MITPEQLARSGSEHSMQAALFCWCASSNISELKWLFAIPNGGLRDARTAGRLKAEGVKSGVWDIFLPYPKYKNDFNLQLDYIGLWIEFKIGKNILTKEQKEFKIYVESQGYKTAICYDWQSARDCILEYLGKSDGL